MVMIRTTWFFKVNNYGWTENFHHSSVDLNVVEARCNALAPYRKALLGNNGQLVGVRLSDDDVFRDSVFLQNPPFFGPGTYPGPCDPAFTALLTRWDASNVTRKNLYLRGIPDELVELGAFVNDPAWAPRWTAYRQQVASLGFGIKRLSQSANPYFGVQSINADGLVSTTQSHNFVNGDIVHFTGVKTSPKIPTRVMVFAPIQSFNFSLIGWVPRGAVYPANGRVRKYSFEVVPIITGIWERVVKKSTGRPFDTPRGRRRVVR